MSVCESLPGVVANVLDYDIVMLTFGLIPLEKL